uniref:Malonyl-CoA decarboxylase n=1 Tax=Kalanchoe fedtschenkoi TaxID=63787 RepID=A0A7N0UCX8_KALFE
MSKKALSILLRTRMRRPNDHSKLSPSSVMKPTAIDQMQLDGRKLREQGNEFVSGGLGVSKREMGSVLESMRAAITMKKTEFPDSVLDEFSEGYLFLSHEDRMNLLLVLAKEYDCDRASVRDLMKQYLGIELPAGDKAQTNGPEEDVRLSAFYRTEKNLRQALKPAYELLFEQLNTHRGGLKFLTILRADILSILREENIASLRALDTDLKEKLITWLSPAALELHQLTWDDSASLLEKIVACEALHPISSLVDLKRRLGVGRRCFGYFHPAIPGEPLIFIEVALLRKVAETIQEVLWDEPPIPEHEATCALFYSISSTQPGLAGINLGKFLIKRVVTLLRRDMPHISTFATLSPIPGFMQWLLSKLASQSKLAEAEGMPYSSKENTSLTFQENILEPEEENALLELSIDGRNGMEKMLNLISNADEWASSDEFLAVLKTPLMRLCARYLLQEKKRGKALDSVANFHLQNGAMVERINWMADKSEKGLAQSGGIMVNYVYRLESIEDYAQSYFTSGTIQASADVHRYVQLNKHSSSNE